MKKNQVRDFDKLVFHGGEVPKDDNEDCKLSPCEKPLHNRGILREKGFAAAAMPAQFDTSLCVWLSFLHLSRAAVPNRGTLSGARRKGRPKQNYRLFVRPQMARCFILWRCIYFCPLSLFDSSSSFTFSTFIHSGPSTPSLLDRACFKFVS